MNIIILICNILYIITDFISFEVSIHKKDASKVSEAMKFVSIAVLVITLVINPVFDYFRVLSV